MEPSPTMLDPGVGVLSPGVASGAGITSGFPQCVAATSAGAGFKQNVFILRHGERRDDVDKEWLANASRPWDPPLTDAGKKQAWNAGRKLRLAGFEINRVLISPYLRCVQTAAEAIMALCVNQTDLGNDSSTGVVIDPSKVKASIEFGLSEVMNSIAIRFPRSSPDVPWILDLGELQSLLPAGTLDAVAQSMWPQLPEWPEETEASHVRYGKTFRAAADRFPGENILCVTHGEGVAVSVSHLQPVLVYGVDYCACSHWQRTVREIDGKLSAGEFELRTEPLESGVLFGDVFKEVPA
ncbi:uncharacterized protein LOC9659801 [Selaginella moellendorffii]|nr:uncharacterized protein LOC9659801 [Selaginella moellendorffii]|eukprot:XP_002978895.2 uncharacterized protein LOC9659801 [Selaginella moellendorffii]